MFGKTLPDLTPRTLCQIMVEEALVREAYKDARGNWTWGFGLTNASGHTVHPRYLDNPQSVQHCYDVFEWVVRNNYLPAVVDAFARPLNENELASALSFHWNTGAIGSALWVDKWNAGDVAAARYYMTQYWTSNGLLTKRREREAALFFDADWPEAHTFNEWGVNVDKTVNWDKVVAVHNAMDLVTSRPLATGWPKTFNDAQEMVAFLAERIE